MKSFLSVFLVAVLCLASFGCGGGTTSNLIKALNAVSDASSVAVVVVNSLQALGKVSAADATLVANYSTSVGAASNSAIAELGSTDTNVQKITKITATFSAVVAPAFPPGVAAQIPVIIAAVSATIDIFLRDLNGTAVVTAAKAAPKAPIVLSGADKSALKKIQEKTAQTATLAATLKAKK